MGSAKRTASRLKRFFVAAGLPLRDVRVPTRLQYQTTECGVAALAMLLAHFGKHIPTEELRTLTGVSRDCVNAADIARAARQHGLECKAFSREPDQLEDLPKPFLAHLRFIHFVVIEGFSATEVLFNDPHQGRSRMPREQFHTDFTGVVICCQPGPTFKIRAAAPATLGALWQRLDAQSRRAFGLALATGLLAAASLPALALALGQWANAPATGANALPLVLLAALYAGLLALRGQALLHLGRALQLGQTRLLTQHFLALPPRFFVYRLPSILHDTLYRNEVIARLCSHEVLPSLLRLAAVPPAMLALAWLQPLAALAVGLPVLTCLASTLAASHLLRGHKSGAQEPAEAMLAAIEDLENDKLSGKNLGTLSDQLGGLASSQHARQEVGEFDALLQALATACTGAALAGTVLCLALAPTTAGVALGTVALALVAVTPLSALAPVLDCLDKLFHALLPLDDVMACPAAPQGDGLASATTSLISSEMLRATNISFGYSTTRPPLLQGIFLSLAAGEQLGLTGPSGGGKSTLAGLLAGHHPPWSGKLEYRQVAEEMVGPPVAWVDRATFFFEGTVRENLCLWQPDIAPELLAQAVHDAGLNEVLAARPGGLDAPVLARARNFSGGQRQRLEIARALLSQPRIMVLDEATDGLDPALEAQIRSNIRRRGCALIVVSHRASTLAACDRVLRVAKGGIQPWMGAQPCARASADAEAFAPASADVEALSPDVPAGPPSLDIDGENLPELQADAAALDVAVRALARSLGALNPQAHPPDPSDPTAVPNHIARSSDPASQALSTNALSALARQHGISLRRVRFTVPLWWQCNTGQLLAFRQDTGAPVVMSGRRRLDPATPLKASAYQAFALNAPTTSADRRTWALLRRKLRQAAPEVAAVLGISLLTAALSVALPIWALGVLNPGQPTGANPWFIGAALVALFAAVGLLDFCRALYTLRAAGRVEMAALTDLARWTARLPSQALRRMAPADYVRSQTSLPRLLHQLLHGKVPQQLLDGLELLAALALVAWLNLRLAGVAATLAVLGMALPWWLTLHGRALEDAQQRAAQPTRRLLYDVLAGTFRLRLLGASERALGHWLARLQGDVARAQPVLAIELRIAGLLEAWPWLALAFLAVLAVVVTGWVELPPWQWPVLLLTLWQMLHAAHGLGSAAVTVARTRHLAAQTDALTGHPLEPLPQPMAPGTHAPSGLALQNIHFAYPGSAQPVLQDLSLRIAPGEFVAITGPSGSGKSTLLRLLAGFEAPQAGDILYNGQLPGEAAWVAWRQAMAMVTQDEVIQASSTLRSQISGMAPYSVQAVWRVIQTVLLDADVRRMPMGLQTIVESGKLSNGQEQRLYIARALLCEPRLLVLDEATNAIPDALQEALLANLRRLGITCILVTHRDSALALMDRVLVLKAGRLVWDGPPGALNENTRLTEMLHAERQQGHA